MPHQFYPADVSDAELLQELMGRVHGYLPLLARDEIRALLSGLQREAAEELEQVSAFSRREEKLLAAVPGAGYRGLLRIHEQLNALEMERFLQFSSVPALHESCTAYRDLLAGRAVELVLEEMQRPAPLPFALISMGSDGREEQTLITDQDYLIVYGDGGSEDDDNYFRDFSQLLVERLAEIGFKKCRSEEHTSELQSQR